MPKLDERNKMTQTLIYPFGFCANLQLSCSTFIRRSKEWLKPECDIRENFDTNECPNIFVSTKLHE